MNTSLKVDSRSVTLTGSTMNTAMTTAMTTTMNQNFLCPITQSVMTDPVIGSDGITYERAAIQQWFSMGHTTSPVTRAPMTSQSLVPNYALKALIEEGGMTAQAAPTAPATTAAAPTPTIQVTKTPTGLTITVSAPDAPDAMLPTLFIDVLDISGSMGGSSMDTSHGTTSDAAAFSRADLVRHSVATQIELLRPQDELAVILFDNSATIALPPLSMKSGPPSRGAAKVVLPQIEPRGGTNIWTGLHRALEMAASADAAGKNTVIILQTDGESDPSYNPPRGIVPTLQAWLDAHPTVRPTIHTVGYGFGHALDMPLLRQIAVVGRGTVNYIPDGSMVGTVFIHMLANLMSATHRDLMLSVPELGWFQSISFLQSGQTREFFLPAAAIPETFTIALRDHTGPLVILDVTDALAAPASSWAHIRSLAIDALTRALQATDAGNMGTAQTHLRTLTDAVRAVCDGHPLIAALLADLDHPDPSKGQIGKAFASADAFGRWGRHYVPGYLSGLDADWCINFKDALSQIPRSPQVAKLIQRGDDLFNSLPPPRASCAARYATGGSSVPLATMASIHSSSGVCFLGASLVKMADGTEKRCDEIRPGDMDIAGYRIRCVLRTLVSKADIVRVGAAVDRRYADGGFTLWHPVFVNNTWQHPADIGTVTTVYTDALYNFVLEKEVESVIGSEPIPIRPGVLIVDGVMTCTLGHGFTGPVIGHDYFGTDGPNSIVADIMSSPGWKEGYVTWTTTRPIRDPTTGHITGMDFTTA